MIELLLMAQHDRSNRSKIKRDRLLCIKYRERSFPEIIDQRREKFTNSPELLTNFCLRELARRWGPAKVGRPANKPLRVEATSDPSSSFESFTDSLAPRVPGPSTFSAEFTTEPATAHHISRSVEVRRSLRIN